MCLDEETSGRVDRRAFLAGAGAIVAATAAAVAAGTAWTAAGGARSASAGAADAGTARTAQPVPPPVPVELAPGLTVLRRASWAGDLTGPVGLPTEGPGDVRVLLVHHSASANGYGEDEVAGQIRQFHTLHTGPEKGWPDVAYNFFVDRFGRVWEGRSGSLDGPVVGDATGGNQGFSQLVCLIGDFGALAPSAEAIDALARILAWIAHRDGVDVTPGATTTFTSRGSNRWPEGTVVDSSTIAGHRDMSSTACPGDTVYARVRGDLPALVAEHAAALSPTAGSATTTAPPAPPGPATDGAAPPAAPPSTSAAAVDGSAAPTGGEGGSGLAAPLAVAGVVGAVGAAVAVPVAARRRPRVPPRPGEG